jgi:hypothetical protein
VTFEAESVLGLVSDFISDPMVESFIFLGDFFKIDTFEPVYPDKNKLFLFMLTGAKSIEAVYLINNFSTSFLSVFKIILSLFSDYLLSMCFFKNLDFSKS